MRHTITMDILTTNSPAGKQAQESKHGSSYCLGPSDAHHIAATIDMMNAIPSVIKDLRESISSLKNCSSSKFYRVHFSLQNRYDIFSVIEHRRANTLLSFTRTIRRAVLLGTWCPRRCQCARQSRGRLRHSPSTFTELSQLARVIESHVVALNVYLR